MKNEEEIKQNAQDYLQWFNEYGKGWATAYDAFLAGAKAQQQLLNKHDVIRSAIGDDNYDSLARLIQLHEMLNNGTGLSHDEYGEHERLVEALDDILPLH